MDFGWDHPFAAVELAWDRETDTVYVTKTYRVREATPVIHSGALRSWGKDLRWAWPRDGRRETLEGAGVALAEQYREQGLDLLFEHAQFEDGSVSVEDTPVNLTSRKRAGHYRRIARLRTSARAECRSVFCARNLSVMARRIIRCVVASGPDGFAPSPGRAI
jgi:hypothetical protein